VKPNIEVLCTPSGFARSYLYTATIAGLSQLSPHFEFDREYYPAWELFIVISGKGYFQHNGVGKKVTTGDAILHDMRLPHLYRSDPDDPWKMLYVVFQGATLSAQLDTWFNEQTFLHWNDASTDDRCARIIEQLIIHIEQSEPDELLISTLIYQMLLSALSIYHSEASINTLRKPEALQRAKQWLIEHFNDNANVQRAADVAHLSYFHFIRQFKVHYGVTPKEFVNRVRIDHAKHLLLHTDLSISLISEQSGFGSYNSFLFHFLQIEEISPRKYRDLWRRY
jgi:AraC family transcriptional regulator